MKALMFILIISAFIISGFGSYINFSAGDNGGGIICLMLALINLFNLFTKY